MASEREEALYAEELKTFWTAGNLSGHLYGSIMGDESEMGKMLCYSEHQTINLHH